MQYLSVHDIAWINTTLAGKALKFNYVTLEEAMAAQYSYGDSTRVEEQAANLLKTLITKKPFAYGNVRTAFIAVTAFLDGNGFALKVDESGAADVIRRVVAGTLSARDAIDALATPVGENMRPGVTLRSLVTHIFNAHAEAIRLLAAGDE